jgi:hypothetical protein
MDVSWNHLQPSIVGKRSTKARTVVDFPVPLSPIIITPPILDQSHLKLKLISFALANNSCEKEKGHHFNGTSSIYHIYIFSFFVQIEMIFLLKRTSNWCKQIILCQQTNFLTSDGLIKDKKLNLFYFVFS